MAAEAASGEGGAGWTTSGQMGSEPANGSAEPATIHDFERAKGNCRHYREVARVMIDAGAMMNELRPAPGATLHGLLDPLWVDAAREDEAVPTVSEADVRLTPNPASAYFELQAAPGAATYRCYNASGQLMGQGRFDERVRIPTATWAPGLYTVEVRFADRAPSVQRVVVNRP